MWVLGSILREKSDITSAQCYQSKITTTQTENINLLSTKVDFKKEILGFLSLTLLVKQESFLVLNNSFIVTRPTDDTCVFLGEGLKLHQIQDQLHYTPALPILTEAKIVGRNKIILSDNDLTTVVSRDEF